MEKDESFEVGSWVEVVGYDGDDIHDPPTGIRVQVVEPPIKRYPYEVGKVFINWKFYKGDSRPDGYGERYDRCWPMNPHSLKKV